MGAAQVQANVSGGPTAAAHASVAGPAAKTASLAPPRGKSGAPAANRAGNSEPLRLQLSDRDILPELATTARPVVRVSRAPWIGAAVAIVVVLAGLILWMQSGSDKPTAAPTAADGVRSSAVLATTPTDPPATVPANPPASAQPSSTTPQTPTQPASPTPVTGQPSAPPNAEGKAPRAEPAQATPNKAQAARSAARHASAKQRTPKDGQPVLTVSSPPGTDENIEGAREALKTLEAAPAGSDKPSGSDETPLAPPSDAPVLRLSPSPAPPSDEAKPEPPPPAPGE
jgi:hypothetical protein